LGETAKISVLLRWNVMFVVYPHHITEQCLCDIFQADRVKTMDCPVQIPGKVVTAEVFAEPRQTFITQPLMSSATHERSFSISEICAL
jgi:hypothetical protein